jgi:uncharacterized membrane protein
VVISAQKIINKKRVVLYAQLMDLTALPKYFNHIQNVQPFDNRPIDEIGKRYIEYAKGLFGQKQLVNLYLTKMKQNELIRFQSDHYVFGHEVELKFEEKNQDRTSLTIKFIIKKHLFIFKIPGVKNYFKKRIGQGLEKLRLS